jgi:hypothetical protein
VSVNSEARYLLWHGLRSLAERGRVTSRASDATIWMNAYQVVTATLGIEDILNHFYPAEHVVDGWIQTDRNATSFNS